MFLLFIRSMAVPPGSYHDPASLLSKETVNAIAVSGDGNYLYIAYNDRVRVWDTRK